jgi:D-threo-aldose 1-dehydrogenase
MENATQRRIGGTGVFVTPLGLGCAAFGNLYEQVSDEAAEPAIATALIEGIKYFDTAPFYGYGLSEQRLGSALARADRSLLTLSTKVGRLLVPRDGEARSDHGFVEANAFDPVFDYSYDGVMQSVEASLERLQTDRIDILLMHDIGAMTHGQAAHRAVFDHAMEGGYRAMKQLRDTGAVGAIGLGVNESEACVEAIERADFDCFLLAGRYTLLEQRALERLLPLCVERGVSIIAGGVFNSGVLVEQAGADRHYDYAVAPDAILGRVERMRSICAGHGLPLGAAALQFPLLHPAVASVIPGARSAAEVETNARWFELDIPSELYAEIRHAELIDRSAPIGPCE